MITLLLFVGFFYIKMIVGFNFMGKLRLFINKERKTDKQYSA